MGKAKKAKTKKAHTENDTSMLSGAMYRAVAARNLRNQLDEDNKSFSEMNEQVVAESKKEPKPKVVKKKKHWYDYDEELVQVQSEIHMPNLQDDLGLSLTRTVQQRNLHHFLNDQAKEDAKAAVHPKASP